MLRFARRGLIAVVVTALVATAPLAASPAIAAAPTLTYGPGTGDAPIHVTIEGTSLTATWDHTPEGPTYGYRVYLWDVTTASYVLEYTTMSNSFASTIQRGHSYQAFYQDLTTDMSKYLWGIVYFTPPVLPAPNAPQNFTLTRTPLNPGFALSWDAPADNADNPIAGYRVTLTGGGGPDGLWDITGRTASITSLAIGTTYTVSVQTIAADGQLSSAVSVTKTLEATAPTAPRSVQLAVAGRTLTASWLAPTYNGGGVDALSYSVELWGGGQRVDTYTASSTSLQLPFQAEYGVQYKVIVRAVNTAGQSPAADSATVVSPWPAPAPPSALTATRLTTANGYELNWTAPASSENPVARYAVDVTAASSTMRYFSSTTTYTFSNMAYGGTYTFAIRSLSTDGQLSTPVSTTVTLGLVAPTAARDVTLTSDNASLIASWTAPSYFGGNPPQYRVELYADDTYVKEVITSSLSVTVSAAAQYGVDYRVQVTAFNAAGNGPTAYSNTTKRADTVPAAPTAFTDTFGYRTPGVYVTWDLTPGMHSPVDELTVTLYDEFGTVVERVVLTTAYSGYNFLSLDNDTLYYLGIVASNLAGDSIESVRVPITTNSAEPPAWAESDLEQAGNFVPVTATLTGTDLEVHLDGVAAGEWVFGHAYSTPVALGYAQVDAAGYARWSIAGLGLAPGTHTVAVQDGYGGLYGSARFAVPAQAQLAHSGSDPAGWAAIALALLGLGAIVTTRGLRRAPSAARAA